MAIYMYQNQFNNTIFKEPRKRCIGNIKAILCFRVKRFGRVLVPFAAERAALGAPFLGRGQPVTIGD